MKLESYIESYHPWKRACTENFFILIPVVLVLVYGIFFINLPISEDTAFYGFLAKQINNGALLHIDIPVSTHGIFIYELAAIFKIFGSGVYVLRIFYLIHLGILMYFLTLILVSISNKYIGSLISSYVVILISLPSIALDIGRSPHVIAMCLMVIAIYVLFVSSISKKYLIGGILLGLAAITRESYALYFIPFVIIAFKRGKWRSFIGGYLSITLLFIIFILFTSDIRLYLQDMLMSGVKFRAYSNGNFFAFEKLIRNYEQLEIVGRKYAESFILLGLIGLFIRSKNELISSIKIYILPCALIIEIFINKAASYSIQPVIILLSPLVIEALCWMFYTFSKSIKLLFSETFNIKALLFILIIFFSFNNFTNIYNKYRQYNRVTKNFTSQNYLDSNPYRLLEVIDQIPHNSISAYSEYPLVFLSKVNYSARFPYLEDLSAANNMSRPDIWEASLEALNKFPPDILVEKTTDTYFGNKTPFGIIREENYMKIADFEPASNANVVDAYADRIAISNIMFSNMKFVKRLKVIGNIFNYFNESGNAVIIKVYPNNKNCKISILNNLSKVKSSDNIDNKYVSSIVLPKTKAVISIEGDGCNNQLYLDLYNFN